MVLCALAVRLLAVMNPGDIARFDELSIDWRVLVFALTISVATGLSFGAFPALAVSRADVADLLREGGGRGIAGSGTRFRRVLVGTNVALSVVLLGGAGLLIRSYLAVQGADKSFGESTLTMELASDGTADPPRKSVLYGAPLWIGSRRCQARSRPAPPMCCR